MATSIGPRIGVQGYNEFKAQMDTIVSKLKALENEAAALEKRYEGQTDSLEYLTKKSENYTKQLELQRKGLEEAGKWTQKATDYVKSKEEATARDNLAVAKAEELESKYSAALQSTEVELNKTNSAIQNYEKNLLSSADAAEDTADRTSAATIAIGNLISKLVEEAARLGKQIVETGVSFNAKMESYRAGFTTLLGSEQEAGAALNTIIETAKKAPTFSLEGLVEANRTLIAAGSNAEEANQQVLDLANALAAAGKSDEELTRMALNLQQIANNGQAYAIDLKQFNNAGIPVWKILADYTGKTKDELSGTVITFEMLTGALQQAAGEGGRYFGALDAQAETLNGQFNKLKNNVRRELGGAFEGLTNILKETVLPSLNRIFESDESFQRLISTTEGVAAAIAVIGIEAKIAGAVSSETFGKAAAKVALYKISLDKGTISQAEFTASMSGSDIIVGLWTGKISAATAGTWLLNTAMAALPFVAVAAGIGLLVTGIKNYNNSVKEVRDSNILDTDNIEELEDHLAEMKARVEELDGIWPEWRTHEEQVELEGLQKAIGETKTQIEELRAAEQAEIEYTTSAEGQLNSIVDETKQKLSELYAAYDENYAKAYEAAQKQFEIFQLVSTQADTSTEDMIAALNSQSEYWNNYSDNLEMVRDINYGLSEDVIKALSDGSQASAGYLQSIINDVNAAGGAESEAGQKIIQDINKSFADLKTAQEGYADQAALTATNFEHELANTIGNAVDAMNELEMSEEMKAAAADDLKAFIAGLDSQSNALSTEAYNIGNLVAKSLQRGINSVNIHFPAIELKPGGQVGGYAKGLDYVPYDEFPAYLHRGEMVLTAAEAARYRSGDVTTNNRTSTANNVVNMYAQQIDEATVDYLYQKFNSKMGVSV